MADQPTPEALPGTAGVGFAHVHPVETAPTRDEVIAGERHGGKRQGRPPKADAAMIERIRLLLESPGNDHLPATEVLRRAAE